MTDNDPAPTASGTIFPLQCDWGTSITVGNLLLLHVRLTSMNTEYGIPNSFCKGS